MTGTGGPRRIAAGDVALEIGEIDGATAVRRLDAHDRVVAGSARVRRTAETSAAFELVIAGERFLIALAAVEAVVPLPRLARLPEVPAACLGAFAHAARVRSVFDPAAALGAAGSGEPARIAVVLRGEPMLALAVQASALHPGVEALLPPGADAITSLAPTADGSHAAVIDPDRLRARLVAR